MCVSFCLPHPVVVSAFIILVACVRVLLMLIVVNVCGVCELFAGILCEIVLSRQQLYVVYGCINLLVALVLVCVDVMEMSSA